MWFFLLDLDLVFIVVVLLASKSCVYPESLPSPVTLRLGTVLKASPVPVLNNTLCFRDLQIIAAALA